MVTNLSSLGSRILAIYIVNLRQITGLLIESLCPLPCNRPLPSGLPYIFLPEIYRPEQLFALSTTEKS